MGEKKQWLKDWCANNNCKLELDGTAGFGRPAVGILHNGTYPDYTTYDTNWDETNLTPEVKPPEDAYHKHPCVAVLGTGHDCVEQLYQWVKELDANGYTVQATVDLDITNEIELMLGKGQKVFMAKKA